MKTLPNLATPLTLIAALLLGGCASNGGTASPTAASNPASALPDVKPAHVIAEVNGHPIGQSALPRTDKSKPGSQDQALDEVIARELIWQDFTNKNLGNDPATQEQVHNMLRIAYSQIAAEHYMKSLQISDDELRKIYAQKKQALVSKQYKLKHILLEDEATAKATIAKLAKGEDFDKLAKKVSKDDNTKNQGGELGWVDPRAMGPAFEKALATMKNGEFASVAIQTQFGWHIIFLEDTKVQEAPAFEAVKDKVLANVRTEKFQEYLKVLKANAKITKVNTPK
ncbi:MAG: peptidylprolyl isomerase [Methylococcales bacterium]|nr:peptidylprolyl isomerase [Methylococcales bacterium]